MPEGKYHDSQYIVYHGPRRGGKTLSMAYDAFVDMASGRTVYSNYPIIVREEQSDGSIITYESQPLNVDELLYIDRPDIKKKYNNSIIAWDEGALSLFSRDFMSARNRLMSMVIQLIGKLEMSIYMTAQFLSLIDKNIRNQADAHCFCHDLSFKYKYLERGSTIGQVWQDMSGRFTGDTFETSGASFYQTFHGRDYWGIYDTTKTFAVIQERIKIKEIRAGLDSEASASEASSDAEAAEGFENFAVHVAVSNLVSTGVADSKGRIIESQAMIHEEAKDQGFTGTSARLAILLRRAGYLYVGQGSSNKWLLAENVKERREAMLV